jgi:hypothetical protein
VIKRELRRTARGPPARSAMAASTSAVLGTTTSASTCDASTFSLGFEHARHAAKTW